MTRTLIPGLLFVVLVLFLWTGLSLDPTEVPSPLVGKPAPTFDLESLDDPTERITTETLKGEVSLINVWATWCVACRQEHEALLAIRDTGEVRLFGLNYKDERPKAIQWLKQLGDPYQATAFDPDGSVSIDWGVYGAPETFLVDAQGIVRHKHIGPITAQVWRDELLPMVKTARAGGAL